MYLELCPMNIWAAWVILPSAGSLENIVSIVMGSLQSETLAALNDRIPSTNPGAELPRDARDSGSDRSHSTHLETSSSYRP